MNLRSNAPVETVPQQSVTILGENHVQMEHAFTGGVTRRNANLTYLTEPPVIKRGVLDPSSGDLIDRPDQPVADDRLQRVEPRVVTQDFNGIAITEAVVPQQAQAVGDRIVIGDHNAAVAPDIEVLQRMQRE